MAVGTSDAPSEPRAPASERADELRKLPRIDELVARPELRGAPRWAATRAARAAVEALRQAVLAGGPAGSVDGAALADAARALSRPSLRRVINATGVVLHTNLGRAPLHRDALARLGEVAAGYSTLEYDLAAGRRGSRHAHLVALLADLTGAEDALVVNNNAAAVLLALSAAARDREVVVSRGELIEIGGSFRVPDVMRLSGARLVEVGTTNKTRADDYQRAIGEATGLLLKVHRSNFAIVGFTEEVEAAALAAIGQARAVLTMVDLGSGSLLRPAELSAAGLPAEPDVAATVAAGVDLVSFSGDKLLGGPQAGLLCGRRDAIALCRRHPLMRALRPDKLTLAALEATLAVYRDGRQAELPTVAMLTASPEVLRRRAEALVAALRPPRGVSIEARETRSAVGGGALPLAEPVSWSAAVGGVHLGALDRALAAGEPPVIGRVADDRYLLDVRTVTEPEVAEVAAALTAALTRPEVPRWS